MVRCLLLWLTSLPLTAVASEADGSLADAGHASGSLQDCSECPPLVILPIDAGGAGKSHRLAIGRTEVTEAQFRYFLQRTGYQAGDAYQRPALSPSLPAVYLDWPAARAYVRWLSRFTGQRYRLPTQAEWELAAHGGMRTRYWWGDEATDGCGKEHLSLLFFPFDRQCATSSSEVVEVASMCANPWGLYDMLGNAGEFTEDGKACGGADFSTPYHPAGCGSDFEINRAHTGLRVVRELP